MVLMRNGAVLRGEVQVVGDQVCVLNPGAELRVRASQVAKVASTVEEIYEWQRAETPIPLPADRLRLAEWCQQQQLWRQAAEELDALERLAPGDPRTAAARARLMAAWERDRLGEPASKAPARTTTTIAAPIDTPPLPEGALQEFTRRVQPTLVNNCTISGCHQRGGKQQFQLDRSLVYGNADRRSTLINLMAVLSQIDRESPQASPLLQAARSPHGGVLGPFFVGRRAELLDRMTVWVEAVSAHANQQQAPAIATKHFDPAVGQASYEAPIEEQAPNSSGGGYEYLSKPGAAEQAFGDQPQMPPRRSADPFDPQAFNRRREPSIQKQEVPSNPQSESGE